MCLNGQPVRMVTLFYPQNFPMTKVGGAPTNFRRGAPGARL